MGLPRTYQELDNLSDDQLKELYNSESATSFALPTFVCEELSRRGLQRQTDRMVQVSEQMRNLTLVILFLTLINVALFIGQALGFTR